MSRRAKDEIVVILWRDIPAQINGKVGEEKHGVVLPHRFQKAIDRAAMVAGKKTAQEYVAEWRRESRPCGDDLEAEATAEHARLEAAYDRDRLNRLVDNGGIDPDRPAADA